MEIHALSSHFCQTVVTWLGMAVTNSALTAFGQTFTPGIAASAAVCLNTSSYDTWCLLLSKKNASGT